MRLRERLGARLALAESQHLLRQRKTLQSHQGVRVRADGRELLNFCSNDYLGLAYHPYLIEATQRAAAQWGTGSGASHLVCGHLQLAAELEQRFATWVGAQAALIFSTGYMANLALVSTFAGRGDLVLQDRLNHASLIDGAILSRARLKRYAHGTLPDEAAALVATDTVFSMDGDMAPLAALHRFGLDRDTLMVFDDAHGIGTMGSGGRGSLNACGVPVAGNNLLMATFGKALGTFGAIVAGDQVLIDNLIQFARPYIYTTALPPTLLAGTNAALDLLETDNARREHLFHLIGYFRKQATQLALPLLSSASAIQPLLIGDVPTAMRWSGNLQEKGILVTAIRPPTVPKDSARLRITLSANHTEADIDQLLEELGILAEADPIPA